MIAQEEFQRFFDTIKALRAPNGCPWDKEQTPLSMRNDLKLLMQFRNKIQNTQKKNLVMLF